MKSITFLMMLMILLTAFSLSAQTSIGITAGAVFSNVKIKAEGVSASPKDRTGITAGIFVSIPLSTNISFQPALNFVQKGYAVKDYIGTEKVNFNYIELPLNFVYSTSVSHGLFIGAGPSLAFGFSGNDKFKHNGGIPDTNEKIHFGSGADEVKTFDFGANFIAGYKFKGGFLVSGNYNLGLSKINNDDGSGQDGKIKNRYFGVKIGYVFNGNKHK